MQQGYLKLIFSLALLLVGIIPLKAQQEIGDYFSDRIFVKVNATNDLVIPEFDHRFHSEKWNGPIDIAERIEEFGIKRIFKPFKTPSDFLQKVYEVRFEGDFEPADLVNSFARLGWVEYAEKIPIYDIAYTPDDMGVILWHLGRIDAEAAWDISKGSQGTVIAIVDDAMRYTHEDLEPNLWVNQGEIPDNAIDDDGNGFIDDIIGYDVADDDNDPYPPGGSGFGHGTHVAGLASGATDNGVGVASMGFNCKLMPVKQLDASAGEPGLEATMSGVDYAIAAGADVVNMSFGGNGFSLTYEAMIYDGYTRGMVFVAAAGNDNSSLPFYPAAYDHVISVGSTGGADVKSGFSNYGVTVDVMAPGSSVYSSVAGSDNTYSFSSGTSMASPITAGLVGLMLSYNPTLSPDSIESCLKAGCDNIDSQNSSYIGQIGAGRINANNSMMCIPAPAAPVTNFGVKEDSVCGNTVFFVDSTQNGATYWFWDFGDGSTSILPDPQHTYSASGSYTVTLISGNVTGEDSLVRTFDFEFFPTPLVEAGPDSIGCVGDTIQLWATAGFADYEWSPLTGLQNTTTDTPFVKVWGNVVYIVTVTDSNGCKAADSILINRYPDAPIDAGANVTIAPGDSVQLTASGGSSYTWSPPDGLSCTECPNPWASPDVTILYTLEGIGITGCSGTDYVQVDVVFVGLDDPLDPSDGIDIKVFPNPSSGMTQVSVSLDKEETISLQVFDKLGANVLDVFAGKLAPGDHTFTLPLSGLAKGIYFLRLEQASGKVHNGKLLLR